MDAKDLFLHADAALREVFSQLTAEQLAQLAPAQWTTTADPTIRDIVASHAYDEAWIPGVLAGASIADGDPYRDADLLGDDPVAAYLALNDTATAAVRAGEIADTFRFQYGDYPAAEGFAHLATYRAFQAWLIARRLGIPFQFSDELMDGLDEHVVPHMDEWRQFGVFPPAVDAPEGADRETQILAASGHLAEA